MISPAESELVRQEIAGVSVSIPGAEGGERNTGKRDTEVEVKVVIFCGGLGVRMGEETQRIPKPMPRR